VPPEHHRSCAGDPEAGATGSGYASLAVTVAHARRGFTLIELLVVMTILLVVIGMLMPLVGIAKRASMRSLTQSIMAKTEAALHQYKSDFRGYPYQQSYAGTEPDADWTNTLYYSLGTTITAANASAVRADMATASAGYNYNITPWFNNSSAFPIAGAQAFLHNRNNGQPAQDYDNSPDSDLAPVGAWQPGANSNPPFLTWYFDYGTSDHGLNLWGIPGLESVPTCVLLNRMGGERASDLMLIGAIQAGGVTMPTITIQGLTHQGRDLASVPLVAHPQQSSLQPGWANDYLQGQIQQKYLSGSAVLDAWLHPLIYVGQILPGCETCCAQINGQSVDVSNVVSYGLGPAVSGETVGGDVLSGGRQTLQPDVPGTTTPITGDAYLPDAGNLMHSDRRYWAAPGYELEFELWSAGPDGRFSWWRDDLTNKDNISCEPYDAGIGVQP